MEYEKINIYDEVDLYHYKEEHYYIITTDDKLLDDDFDFETYQAKIYQSIKDKPLGFAKNTSWIICTCINDNSNKDKIMLVEEDEYFFRKLVLYYTKDEVESLEKNLANNDDMLKYLNDVLFDYDKYNDWYKKGKEVIYGLVSRLFIKIPSLKINDYQNSSKEDIQKNLNNSLSNENKNILDILQKHMENVNSFNDDKDFDKIMPILQLIVGDEDGE